MAVSYILNKISFYYAVFQACRKVFCERRHRTARPPQVEMFWGGVSVRSSWFLYIKVRTIRYLSGSVFRPGGLLWGERTLFVFFLLPLCISLQPEPSLTALSAKHMHLPFCLIEILRKAITQQEANLSVTPNRFVKDSL